MTDRPARPPAPARSDLPTFLGVFVLLFLATGLLALAAAVIPQLLGIVIVVAGLGWVSVLHYLVWGYWLSRILKDDDMSE